jgi:hypothetical protein
VFIRRVGPRARRDGHARATGAGGVRPVSDQRSPGHAWRFARRLMPEASSGRPPPVVRRRDRRRADGRRHRRWDTVRDHGLHPQRVRCLLRAGQFAGSALSPAKVDTITWTLKIPPPVFSGPPAAALNVSAACAIPRSRAGWLRPAPGARDTATAARGWATRLATGCCQRTGAFTHGVGARRATR